MKRVKVVHVHKIAGVSGSEKHLLQLVSSLDRARFDPAVFLLNGDPRATEEYARHLHAAGVPVWSRLIRGHVDPRLFLDLVRWFRRERPDIVHTHLIHADFHAIPAARLAGVRVVISTKHNDDRFRRRWPIVNLERWLARRVSHTIAISESLRQFLLETTRQTPQSVSTVRYGYSPLLDAESSVPPPAEVRHEVPTILAVGRLVAQKGHDVLLHAFARVVVPFPDARLVIVGEGEQRAPLERLTRELRLVDRVTFTGHRPNARTFMRYATVFVHPSRWEGFGLVLLEAMAAGVPIVANRVSAIPEVVDDGATGLLVPVDDSDALAKAISRLLEDPALAQRLGRTGRDRLEREFSLSRMVRATEQIYSDALAAATGDDFRRVNEAVC
jgi:glycosyltransferase involved in cell wall biosynthesis